MTRVAVDLARLAEVLEELERCERTLVDARADVDRAAATLHGSWTGAAASAQRSAQDEWAAGEVAMRSALARFADVLRGAHANYDAALGANRAIWLR